MPDKQKKIRGDDPRHSEPEMRGDSRSLDLGRDGMWQWNTNGDVVTIYDPENVRRDIATNDIFGMSKADWAVFTDRDHDESSFSITPKDISDYIKGKILGRVVA